MIAALSADYSVWAYYRKKRDNGRNKHKYYYLLGGREWIIAARVCSTPESHQGGSKRRIRPAVVNVHM